MENSLSNRVFIVDDHQLVIDGIKSLLSGSDEFLVSGSSSNPEKVIELLVENPTDILLTDISMPSMSGIELTRIVRENSQKSELLPL